MPRPDAYAGANWRDAADVRLQPGQAEVVGGWERTIAASVHVFDLEAAKRAYPGHAKPEDRA